MHKVRDHTIVLKFSGTGVCAIAVIRSFLSFRFGHSVCWAMGNIYSSILSTAKWQSGSGEKKEKNAMLKLVKLLLLGERIKLD